MISLSLSDEIIMSHAWGTGWEGEGRGNQATERNASAKLKDSPPLWEPSTTVYYLTFIYLSFI